MNLLHDIPAGSKDEMNVIIEVSKGSQNKYEIDKETGLIKLDRANYSAAAFPAEYGFVPQTLWDDGDALDVVVLTTFPIPTGVLVKVRPVALMEMIDTGENDYKVIAVPVKDKRWEDVRDLPDLNKHTLKEIQHFFETYKQLKGEEAVVTINGFKGKADAEAAFEHARKLYEEKK
ncbi:MAG TPA: inorganic diphosphatase [Candidatus Paceibacterota bacterium]|nr:inorganic diphosphatase [Candidatus Paceibacterota bacterium]